MRVLIINYYYPPVVNAHAYRWEQIARHWVEQGHQVEVITSRVHGVADKSEDAGVRVTRIGVVARPIKYSSTSSLGHRRFSSLLLKLINALRPLYRMFYWPDALWHWAICAALEIFSRRREKYDLIVSYYPCMGAHFAAALYKSCGNYQSAKWIADYGDPFSTSSSMPPNNFKLFGRLNLRTERYIAKTSDILVFTNISTAQAYTEMVATPDKVRVIPHLVDLDRFHAGGENVRSAEHAGAVSRRIVNLLYIGGFHRGIREPDFLFDLIRRLNQCSDNKYILNIFGPENGFDLSPEDCPDIIYGGMIEREKAIDLMRRADILVNVENRNCVMIPSKIVEYIGTGRPILNIKDEGVQHPALDVYIDQGYAMSVSRSDISGDQIDAVENFIFKRIDSSVLLADLEVILAEYMIGHVANKYMTHLEWENDFHGFCRF
jgi:glycosyltransferase involved in cell wall biosynthesis